MQVALIVIGLGVVFLVFVVAGMYNRLVTARKQVDNGWSQIDVQLKRRYDLIPNLVETVKGYAAHEKQLFENVTKARSHAMDTASGNAGVAARSEAENALGTALRGFMIQIENYPQLTANENFRALQEELTSTENKISFARQFYNDVATAYNTLRELFPTNIVAGMFGFGPRELWAIADAVEREAPKIKF
jgi:LemA protein